MNSNTHCQFEEKRGYLLDFSRLSLCVDDLDAGRLQILFNLVSPLSEGTSLVYPEFRSKDSRILKFKAWITAEADQFNSRMESYQLK